MAFCPSPVLSASSTLRSSSVMMAPSTDPAPFRRVSRRFGVPEDDDEEDDEDAGCCCSREGSCFRTRQNSWMLLKKKKG